MLTYESHAANGEEDTRVHELHAATDGTANVAYDESHAANGDADTSAQEQERGAGGGHAHAERTSLPQSLGLEL